VSFLKQSATYRPALIGATPREQWLTVLQDHHVPSGAGLRVIPELARLNSAAVRAPEAPDFLPCTR